MLSNITSQKLIKRRSTAYYVANFVDKATFNETSIRVKGKKKKAGGKQNLVTNEIDELADSLDLLFGE